ncbi:MAG TPA: hypothetical protein VGM03_03055, partial [Phycisphaerae bacterium]
MRRLLNSIAGVVLCLFLTATAQAADLTPAKTWNTDRAAHLLRRAGFGGTPEQVRYLTDLDLDGAVDYLVDYEKVSQTDPDFIPMKPPDLAAVRMNMEEV